MTSLRTVTVIFQKELRSEIRTRYALNALLMFVVTTIAVLLFALAPNDPATSSLLATLDSKKKSDIALQEGYWQLYKLDDNTTIGEYGTRVDTGVAVPSFVQNFLARKDIPKALTAFRKYIDSDGKYLGDWKNGEKIASLMPKSMSGR